MIGLVNEVFGGNVQSAARVATRTASNLWPVTYNAHDSRATR